MLIDGIEKSNAIAKWMIIKKKILLAIEGARFTWQQRKANDSLRIKIQHSRLIAEQSKRDKASR